MVESSYQKIVDPGAWVGSEFKNCTDWIYDLSSDAISDIEYALNLVKAKNLEIPFEKSEFPISVALDEINAAVEEALIGSGCSLIRGIPQKNFDVHECELIYWGLGIHMGSPVSQNRKGDRLGHVKDQGLTSRNPKVRLYQTSEKMDFHCDMLPVDLLGLFCVNKAKSGGWSHVVSSLTVHNILLEERPDLLETAFNNFYLDWRGEEGPGNNPWYSIPMFSVCQNKLTARFTNRLYCQSSERFGPEFKISAKQLETLDYVQEISNREELRLSMLLEEGDIQILNNHITMHGRDTYLDHQETDKKRHLLRMWLRLENDKRRPLANSLDVLYSVVLRNGIPTANHLE